MAQPTVAKPVVIPRGTTGSSVTSAVSRMTSVDQGQSCHRTRQRHRVVSRGPLWR